VAWLVVLHEQLVFPGDTTGAATRRFHGWQEHRCRCLHPLSHRTRFLTPPTQANSAAQSNASKKLPKPAHKLPQAYGAASAASECNASTGCAGTSLAVEEQRFKAPTWKERTLANDRCALR
jgi:hypothetical protein